MSASRVRRVFIDKVFAAQGLLLNIPMPSDSQVSGTGLISATEVADTSHSLTFSLLFTVTSKAGVLSQISGDEVLPKDNGVAFGWDTVEIDTLVNIPGEARIVGVGYSINTPTRWAGFLDLVTTIP